MSDVDLLLLHAPSVYDFRKRAILYGPVSDLIPSSPVFEMYPLGFLTMASYLAERGLKVRIVNLALRMMNDLEFDVPAFLSRISPRAIGIDLHWLPHAHGSIEIARLVKQIHPDVPVIFGGLSSTYFHRQLIEYPEIDFVLRGDSIEPPLYQLFHALGRGKPFDHVPNLTWKENGEVCVNPMSFVPENLDYVDIRPDRMVQMALRYRDVESVLPFNGWWHNPITAVFTVKGCVHQCVTCGSSRGSCGIVTGRSHPVFRSPGSLIRNMKDIAAIFRGPIFLVGDIRQGGETYARQVLSLLRENPLENEVVFELFDMPPADFLQEIDRSVRHWSLELSPESHDPDVRLAQDQTTHHSTDQMERLIEEALRLRCNRVDVFFMIGLPRQTIASVSETIDYCESLFHRFDRRVSCFISPMGPFLDPGSHGFEAPEAWGYRLFAKTLEEHRQLLLRPSWKEILNYETRWMNREQLVAATYDAGERLNAMKLKYGRIPERQAFAVANRIHLARKLQHRLDESGSSDSVVRNELTGEIHEFSVSTVCDKRELFWPRHAVNFHPMGILRPALEMLRVHSPGSTRSTLRK